MENNEIKLRRRQRFLIVIISILAFTTLVSFVYASVQRSIANENALLAQENAFLARHNAERAIQQTLLAQKSAEVATRQMTLAQASIKEALKKRCK